MNSCRTSSPIRLLALAAFSFVALMSAPAAALSPEECVGLQQRIRELQKRTRILIVAEQIAEGSVYKSRAREAMVAKGCNRAARRNDPECKELYAIIAAETAAQRTKVQQAHAQRRVEAEQVESDIRVLRGQHAAECRGQAARRPRPPAAPDPAFAEAIGAGIATGIILGPMMGGPSFGPRGPRPRVTGHRSPRLARPVTAVPSPARHEQARLREILRRAPKEKRAALEAPPAKFKRSDCDHLA